MTSGLRSALPSAGDFGGNGTTIPHVLWLEIKPDHYASEQPRETLYVVSNQINFTAHTNDIPQCSERSAIIHTSCAIVLPTSVTMLVGGALAIHVIHALPSKSTSHHKISLSLANVIGCFPICRAKSVRGDQVHPIPQLTC